MTADQIAIVEALRDDRMPCLGLNDTEKDALDALLRDARRYAWLERQTGAEQHRRHHRRRDGGEMTDDLLRRLERFAELEAKWSKDEDPPTEAEDEEWMDLDQAMPQIAAEAAARISAQAERIAELQFNCDAYRRHRDSAVHRAEAAERERDELRALLAETLQPGAYGIGSTLAQRIDRALAPERAAQCTCNPGSIIDQWCPIHTRFDAPHQ